MDDEKALATIQKVKDAAESIAEHKQPAAQGTALAKRAAQRDEREQEDRRRDELSMPAFLKLMTEGITDAVEKAGATERAIELWSKAKQAASDAAAYELNVTNAARATDPEQIDKLAQNRNRRALKLIAGSIGLALCGMLPLALFAKQGALVLLAWLGYVTVPLVLALAVIGRLATGESFSLGDLARLSTQVSNALSNVVDSVGRVFKDPDAR